MRLSKLSVEGLLSLLRDIEELEPTIERLARSLEDNAISGRVLLHCDLFELKSVINSKFKTQRQLNCAHILSRFSSKIYSIGAWT